MTYIMENITIIKNADFIRTCCLVERNQISFLGPIVRSYKHMRLNVDAFVMTAPNVMFIPQVLMDEDFYAQKEFYCNQLIRKGCTTFLTYAEINFEFELQDKINQLKKNLLNSPLDYVIGVKIPIRLLTVRFMRECQKRKIPAIFVAIEKGDELDDIPWGWIKEAMFPHNCPLIPIFLEDKHGNEIKRSKMVWQKITTKGKLASLSDELNENDPIPIQGLAKMGIYPAKGSIHHGAEVSYNLYQKGEENNSLYANALYQEHKNRLMVTVHKGTVIRAGEHIKFQPGYGEYLKSVKPAFFSLEN